eukprot:4850662-Prymnesium_polylepis.1
MVESFNMTGRQSFVSRQMGAFVTVLPLGFYILLNGMITTFLEESLGEVHLGKLPPGVAGLVSLGLGLTVEAMFDILQGPLSAHLSAYANVDEDYLNDQAQRAMFSVGVFYLVWSALVFYLFISAIQTTSLWAMYRKFFRTFEKAPHPPHRTRAPRRTHRHR